MRYNSKTLEMELTLDQALQKGIGAHKAGKVQEADQYYTAILKAQPKHPDANHNMGVLAVGVGKVQEALPFFKTALDANPKIAQFWLSYIDALMKLGRLAEAKNMFDQARRKGVKGDSFDKLEQRLAEANRGPIEGVITEQTVEQIQPNILDSVKLDQALKLAKKRAKDGSSAEAKRIYQDILVKFPKNKRASDGLKVLPDRSAGKLSKVQALTQDQVQSVINLYNQGHLQQALEQVEALVQNFPKSAILFNIQGAILKGLSQLELSIEAYKKALSIKPDYAEAHNNMGNALKDQGKLEEALEAYTKALSIKPDYAEAHNNIGNTLREQGKLDEAIEAYNKALAIKPDYAEAHNNMGVALQEQDKLEEAIDACNKAISIKPDFAEAHNNMGNALKEQGRLNEAIRAYTKALSIKPDYADAHNNMGIALKDQGKLDEAIEAYTKALSIKPDYAETYNNMGLALKDTTFNKPNRDLQKTIVSLLYSKKYVRPKDIAKAAISLLKFEPNLQEHLHSGNAEVIQNPIDVISDLSELPLLLKLMNVCPLPDLELEKLLKNLRKSILFNISSSKEASPKLLRFQSALALQCFTNEYIYNHTEEEEQNLQALEKIIKKTLKNNQQPSPQTVLALTSYKALNQYKWHTTLVVTDEIKEVFIRQIEEPNEEEKLKQDLSILEGITDGISSKVRAQYEESPYPRWVNLGFTLKPMSISKVVDEIKLKLHDNKITEVTKPEILIAGCGTGQHSIGTAARFKSSNVLAIDLSLSSLAYANRKTEELGIENINHMNADILDLKQLNKQFDIIESAGVLHHMDNPMAGWKVLTDCLKPGGLIKIGLYSELARQHIVQIRQEIKELGTGSSKAEIRSFRDMIMKSDKDHHKLVTGSADFYSLSTLRDLLFHIQEHRFTVPQIKGCINKLGLKFCGFESKKIVSHFTQINTNKGDPYDLDKWQAYEEANPRAFAGMYQFWCQKAE